MKWIQATLTFSPEQVCMSRPGLGGVWRVHHCAEVGNPLITRVDDDMLLPDYSLLGQRVLRIMVARPYKRGVMVKPIKLALEFYQVAQQ